MTTEVFTRLFLFLYSCGCPRILRDALGESAAATNFAHLLHCEKLCWALWTKAFGTKASFGMGSLL